MGSGQGSVLLSFISCVRKHLDLNEFMSGTVGIQADILAMDNKHLPFVYSLNLFLIFGLSLKPFDYH